MFIVAIVLFFFLLYFIFQKDIGINEFIIFFTAKFSYVIAIPIHIQLSNVFLILAKMYF